jgi:hypothetical protein
VTVAGMLAGLLICGIACGLGAGGWVDYALFLLWAFGTAAGIWSLTRSVSEGLTPPASARKIAYQVPSLTDVSGWYVVHAVPH